MEIERCMTFCHLMYRKYDLQCDVSKVERMLHFEERFLVRNLDSYLVAFLSGLSDERIRIGGCNIRNTTIFFHLMYRDMNERYMVCFRGKVSRGKPSARRGQGLIRLYVVVKMFGCDDDKVAVTLSSRT